MRKGSDLLGKPVAAYDTGERFAQVLDLIFDQDTNQLLALLLSEGGFLSSAKVLPLDQIKAIGSDAVITDSEQSVVRVNQVPQIQQIMNRHNILRGTHILTTDGRDLGKMIDLFFDEATGAIEGYEVSGGLFADAYSGRSFVPAPQTLRIGEHYAFVPTEVAALMEEQVGGIKAAMLTAGEQVQTTAQATSEKLQAAAQVTGEKLQTAAQVTGDKLQVASQDANERFQLATVQANDKFGEFKRSATASLTNAVIDPALQKEFVLGKLPERSVKAADGTLIAIAGEPVTATTIANAELHGVLDELYRATGGRLSDELNQQATSRVASYVVEQAQGLRVQQMVRTRNGIIVAAPGQIVSDVVIARAKQHHMEQALLAAVGLSTEDAARQQAGSTLSLTGDRFNVTAQSLGENVAVGAKQMQVGAVSLWEQAKIVAHDLQARSAVALEERRIKAALGRPVTRVILNVDDVPILNVGDLVTHQAIAEARLADVLDILLSSVSYEKPHLSEQDHRVPHLTEGASVNTVQ